MRKQNDADPSEQHWLLYLHLIFFFIRHSTVQGLRLRSFSSLPNCNNTVVLVEIYSIAWYCTVNPFKLYQAVFLCHRSCSIIVCTIEECIHLQYPSGGTNCWILIVPKYNCCKLLLPKQNCWILLVPKHNCCILLVPKHNCCILLYVFVPKHRVEIDYAVNYTMSLYWHNKSNMFTK